MVSEATYTMAEQERRAPLAPHLIEHDHGNHAMCDPDECFNAKLRYWRERGAGPGIAIPEGWKGESWMSKQKKVITEALDAGYDPQPVR